MKMHAWGFLVLALWVSIAAAQTSPVLIEPVAHIGGPVPGVPGAVFTYVSENPRIDAAGKLLVYAEFAGPGVDGSNFRGLFYGPPDDFQLIVRQGDQAPDMPEGVILEDIYYAYETLSETGWISFTPDLAGPGILPGVNDRAIFIGPPDDLRLVLQGGDQAPGLPEGVTIDLTLPIGFAAVLSDNGTNSTAAYVAGPGVDETNNRVYWTGQRDDLQVVFRTGMQAPGCPEGVTFLWADLVMFNDAGQLAFRGGLTGPGVTELTDRGRWVGGPGDLQLITRGGGPAPCFPPEITLAGAGGGMTSLNNHGDVNELTLIQGPGVTDKNDLVLYAGPPGELRLLAREGDLVPEAGPDVWIAGLGNSYLNSQREVFYQVRFAGPSIDDSNESAMYLGPYDSPELAIRDGDHAPFFPSDVVLSGVGVMSSLTSMNDVGDIVGICEVVGPSVPEDARGVLWFRHHVLQHWFPLLTGGSMIGGRQVYAPTFGEFGRSMNMGSGGSDGDPQSFNDNRQVAIWLDFHDGPAGIYRITPPVFGDANGDGVLNGRDIAAFTLAVVDRVAYEAQYPDCDADAYCDLNGDGVIDTGDVELFVVLLMGE